MDTLSAVIVFTLLPGSALLLGTLFSIREIARIGEKRILLILLILGFMFLHQLGELLYVVNTGTFRDPVFGEILETGANLIAATSVYYVLAFTSEQHRLKTDLRESQQEIQAVKDRLELIYDNVNDGILLVDLDTQEIIDANRTAHELLRYPVGELEGLSPYDIHPHEPEQFQELTDAIRPDGGVITETMSCRRSDGSKMPAAVSASGVAIEDTNLLLVTIRDNSDREQYRTQVDLLGRVLRHNLRNDISVVLGALESLEGQITDPTLETHVDRSISMCKNLIRMSDKTRKLNEILDAEEEHFGRVTDLVPLLDNLAPEYREAFPDATIDTDLPDTAAVQASKNVRWAIENVLENALVHTGSEPHVSISLSQETTVEDGQPSEWTALTIADDGPGIPAEEVRVLQDDSNRSPTEHGSGIGLWIVQQLTRTFDGQLDIRKNPDTEFTTAITMRLQPARNGDHPSDAES